MRPIGHSRSGEFIGTFILLQRRKFMTSMTKQEVAEAVAEVCADTLRVPLEKFVPEARFVEDLEVDSLYVVQLAIALEERFEIQMSEDDSRSLVTVQDMVDLIYRKLTTNEVAVSSTQRPASAPVVSRVPAAGAVSNPSSEDAVSST
jgi:acyl carrier protein